MWRELATLEHFKTAAFPRTSRYFLNVHYQSSGSDKDGEELSNDGAAWLEATLIAGELFEDIDGKFRPGQESSLEVTDERRRPLYLIRERRKVLSARVRPEISGRRIVRRREQYHLNSMVIPSRPEGLFRLSCNRDRASIPNSAK